MAKKSASTEFHAKESEEKPTVGSVQSPLSQPHKEVQHPPVVAVHPSPNAQLPKEDQKAVQEEPTKYMVFWQQTVPNRLRVRNFKYAYLREMFAEFLGTFVLVVFGLSCNAQDKFYMVYVGGGKGSFLISPFTPLGWGIAVALGVYVAGGCSGGHVNPAVTLTFAVFGRIPWLKVPFYFAGQYLGAFLGTVVVYLCYFSKEMSHQITLREATDEKQGGYYAAIFATYPLGGDEEFHGCSDRFRGNDLGVCAEWWECLINQVVTTALLMLMIMAITDERNMQASKGVVPIAIGLVIMGLMVGFGVSCGGAFNPARDLMPRIFSAMIGWGGTPFSFRKYTWFWVPIVAPHLGALIGGCLYSLLVGFHWPKPVEPKPVEQKPVESVEQH